MATKIIGKVSIVPYGDWQASTTYPRLAVVSYQGGSYIALVDNTNIVPTNDSVWNLLTAPGRGIQQIKKIGTVGLVDTYRITYTDGTHFDYMVNNGASKTSELTNDAGFITNQVNDLANYLLAVDTGAYIELLYDSEGYTITVNLKNSSNMTISTSTAQLPLGGNYVSSSYNDGVITLTKLDGTSDIVELSDLVKKSTTIAGVDLGNDITAQELIKALDVYTIPEISDNFTFKSVTGENINLDDSSNLIIKDFQLIGNATQDTNILTYKCIGTEVGDYYFTYNDSVYQFTMPEISAGELLTFNTSTKKLYQGTTKITTTTASTGTLITLNSTPNPDYSVPIKVVTGDNTVKVIGKNFFDKDNANWIKGYLSNDDGGYFTGSSANSALGERAFIDVLPNTNYKFSFNFGTEANSYTYMYVCEYDRERTYIRRVAFNVNSVLTTQSNTRYLRFSFHQLKKDETSVNVDATQPELYVTNIQLELGSTATAYEPYAGQTQLLSLGDIELAQVGGFNDRIYKSVNKWYIEKVIGHIASYNGETINTSYISSTGGLDNGATIYYVLDTIVTTEIMDTTLIQQLDNILRLRTYDNITNILVQTINGTPYLYVEYIMNQNLLSQSMEMKYENLLDQFPTTTTIERETINVQDSANLPIKEFRIKGEGTKLIYTCIGTETGDYYFTYNNVNYQFTMPTFTRTSSETSYPTIDNVLIFDIINLELSWHYTFIIGGLVFHDITILTTTNNNTGIFIELQKRVITGDITLKIRGKNLVDIKDRSAGYFNTNGSINGYYGNGATYFNEYIPVPSSNQIWFRIKAKASNVAKVLLSRIVWFAYDENLKPIRNGAYGSILWSSKYLEPGETWITSHQCVQAPKTNVIKYMRISIYSAYWYETDGTTRHPIDVQTKLEDYFEEIAVIPYEYTSDYEAYQGQTQLLNLGNIQLAPTDTIQRINNVWCINETPITNVNLKSQLENIPNLQTYKNETNICSITNNAIPMLQIEYRKDLETMFNNLESRISLLE